MYKRIKELREDRDLKQKEIADILCITQSTYSRYENGQLDIPSECLVKLAQF